VAQSLYIGLITETFPPEVNGVAMSLGRLLDGLTESGHNLQLIRPRQHSRDLPGRDGRLSVVTLPGMSVPFYKDLRIGFPAGATLLKLWRFCRPDVIYIATEGPLGSSALHSARRLDIPVVSGFHTNFHSYSQHYRMGLFKPLVENYLRYFHRRTACTLAPNRELCRELGNKGFGEVRVLPRGVDGELFSPGRRNPRLRAQWHAGEDDPVALYVGRIAAEKNITEAIHTCRAMQESAPGLRFVLVGDGPLKERLARENPDFHFAGVKTGTELAEHYASADIFLFPSRTETFGNVTLEAMASGLAVIAYDYAAAHMHIRHLDTGLVVPTDTAGGFLQAGRELIQSPVQIKTLGRAARKYSEQLGWDKIIREFENTLRSFSVGDIGNYAEENL